MRAVTFSPLTQRTVSAASFRKHQCLFPPVECVSSGWRVNRVRRGCLIGLTKLTQVPERRKWFRNKGHVFEMRSKRRNNKLKITFSTDLLLILFITLSRNFGLTSSPYHFLPLAALLIFKSTFAT